MGDFLGLTTKTGERRCGPGRRRHDLPPNLTRLLVAWAVAWPGLLVLLDHLTD